MVRRNSGGNGTPPRPLAALSPSDDRRPFMRGARPGIILLVTGFGAFPGARTNPTAVIARRLADSRRLARLDVTVEARVFPVVFERVGADLQRALAESKPDAILHLGLAARRGTISVETRAINRLGPLRVDAARKRPGEGVVEPGGPSFRAASWPAARIRAAIASTGVPARVSINAGDYLCNQLLYLTLALTGKPAGFLHVPRPGAGARRGTPSRPTLAELTQAAETALLLLAREARRLRS